MINKIYLITPKIIEQPTWGGRYILETKNWNHLLLYKNLQIGQSYELFSESKLRGDIQSSLDPSFSGELGYAMQPNKVFYQGNSKKLIKLNDLIKHNPLAILGKNVLKKHGNKIRILIKFTQAKGNSFQLHVSEKDSCKKWHFKAESWYYFEAGLLTLGVRRNIDWEAYKNCCIRINQEMEKLSKAIQDGKLSLADAKLQAKILIKKYNPWQFVNLVKVKSNDLVDLSNAGIHHSWEEDNEYPLGNVLYEMCLDEMDPVSVVRNFDKGKFDKNGALRKLDIEDYYKYIDRSWYTNNPNNHLLEPKIIFNKSEIMISNLFKSKYYCLNKLEFIGNYQEKMNGSFHHLFVRKGEVMIVYNHKTILKLTKGHSCFIPAVIKKYLIKSIGNNKSIILKTFVN